MIYSNESTLPRKPLSTPRRVIIDCDPGIDDALALMLALRSHQLKIEGITTVAGNVALDRCVTNIFQILRASNNTPAPPVARGCDAPLRRKPVTASHVHGTDGLGDIHAILESDGQCRYPNPKESPVDIHATKFISELVRKNPGEITIVTLGPLTNIATAINRTPEAMSKVRELIIMGGSCNGTGNVTPVAEFNFFADPEAAQVVIKSGLPITVVGLDVTHKTMISREEFLTYAEQSNVPGAKFLIDVSKQYFDFAESCGKKECFLHDPLAIGVAIDPTIISTEKFSADIETLGSLTSGMLVVDRREILRHKDNNIFCGVEVDAGRFIKSFLDGLFA